jgi:hypothetical protein
MHNCILFLRKVLLFCVYLWLVVNNFAIFDLVFLGPKLFKEPSSKSNKPIIHNAISHCCLAGKVNEPHKNSILEASVKFYGGYT